MLRTKHKPGTSQLVTQGVITLLQGQELLSPELDPRVFLAQTSGGGRGPLGLRRADPYKWGTLSIRSVSLSDPF